MASKGHQTRPPKIGMLKHIFFSEGQHILYIYICMQHMYIYISIYNTYIYIYKNMYVLYIVYTNRLVKSLEVSPEKRMKLRDNIIQRHRYELGW